MTETITPGLQPTADAQAAFTAAWDLTMAGRHENAEPAYRLALGLDPTNVAAWTNLGATLALLKRPQEAEACYRQALTIDPQDSGALRNLGVMLRAEGRIDDLSEVAEAASRMEIALPAALAMRAIPQSGEDIDKLRAAYADGLRRLASRPDPLSYDGEPFPSPTFQLAYHARDNRPLMEATAEVFRAKAPALSYVSANGMRRPSGGRIRLAIVSDNLFNHTIGHLYRGIVARLDRRRFEVFVVHGAHSRHDAFRDRIDAVADRAISLSGGLADQHRQIEDLEPDVIFYPDIGMTPGSYFLAFARLAPVQATGWGHPDTTGLDTLDYFISTTKFEPPNAQKYYTERLVELPRIPCWFEPPPVPEDLGSRAALGLPDHGTLYGCPQTLFKLHPDFDAVLAAIADGDPNGHIVLPMSDTPGWMETLQERWARRWPRLAARVHWTPRIAQDDFLRQLAHIDVLLDPLHFGSGYTFYQAMIHGVPMVTCPGEFARGRVVAGAYSQMGAGHELISRTPADYASLALSLGAAPERRAALRRRLAAAARAELFGDTSALQALEEFFTTAVEAVGIQGARQHGPGLDSA